MYTTSIKLSSCRLPVRVVVEANEVIGLGRQQVDVPDSLREGQTWYVCRGVRQRRVPLLRVPARSSVASDVAALYQRECLHSGV